MPTDPSIALGVKMPQIQSPLETMQQIGQLQMQRQAIQSNQALEQDRQLKAKQMADAANIKSQVDALMQAPDVWNVHPLTGLAQFNTQAIVSKMAQSGMGSDISTYAPHFDAINAKFDALNKAKLDVWHEAIHRVEQSGNSPAALQFAIAGLGKNGAISDKELDTLVQGFAQNPTEDGVKNLIGQLKQNLPGYQAYELGQQKTEAQTQEAIDKARVAHVQANLMETTGRPEAAPQETPSASYKEWRDYQNEETKAGRKPLPFNDYMTMDANRKRPLSIVTQQEQQSALQKLIGPTVDAQGNNKPSPLVQQAIDGLIDPNKVASNNRWTPMGLTEFKNEILKADPTWNENRFKVRQKYTDGTSQPAKNIVALNTAANHMGLLYDLSLAMGNKDIQGINRVVNYMRTQFGYAGPSDAVMAANALGAETASALKGANAAATDPEIDNWVKTNSTARSPEQIRSNAKTLGTILTGRMLPLQSQWQQSYGKNSYFPILDDYAQQAFQKVGVPTNHVMGKESYPGGIKILSIEEVKK